MEICATRLQLPCRLRPNPRPSSAPLSASASAAAAALNGHQSCRFGRFPASAREPTKLTIRTSSGSLCRSSPFFRSTTSDEIPTTVSEQYDTVSTEVPIVEESRVVVEEAPPEESPFGDSPSIDKEGLGQLLENLNLKMGSEDSYSIFLYGTSALFALWISSVVVSAVESVPLFPKLMEVVGLGYSVWFSYRYLIFKKNRDELGGKLAELKQQIFGSPD